MAKTIRQPQQERSNEKKNKIIEASYKVFAEVGYHSASTPLIAKRAGVSTGIVYSYFTDKRDILLHVLKIYIDDVSKPIEDTIAKVTAPIDYDTAVTKLLSTTIKLHKDNQHLHNTLHALAVSDEDVNAEFLMLEDRITDSIYNKLVSLGENEESLKEKIHLAMNSIQSFAHEYIYDKHKYLDYPSMKKIVCDMVVSLFERK